MPATRVTVALNSNQSQKAPLILPASTPLDPSDSKSCRVQVLKTAQSKLRLKKGTRIFVGKTGHELTTEAEWKAALKDDVVLLVSAGEEYVGARKDEQDDGTHGESNPDCTISILAEHAYVDPEALKQVRTTATTLPGLVHAVGQPDLHPGGKFPIGGVFVSQRWIHPPLIGTDIGCGMAWYKTKLKRNQVDHNKGAKVAEQLRGLEGPWRSQRWREVWLQDGQKDGSAGDNWDRQLGTIGAGNHFAEIQIVEASSMDSIGAKSLHEDDVVLLVHSGSRGYGEDILKKFTSESRERLRVDDPHTQEYMDEHDRACRWAKANRDLIALRFLACLEPAEEAWDAGHISNAETGADIPRSIEHAKSALNERRVVDIWHNNVERILWPPKAPNSCGPDDLLRSLSLANDEMPHQYAYVHRKGAAPTYDPSTRKPLDLLPLPGSRATPTLLLRPHFSETTGWGLKNGLSLAHGAGRSMSRAKALTSVSKLYNNRTQGLLEPSAGAKHQNFATDGRDCRNGTWVICDEKQLVWEEAPDAYKDVYAVSDDLVREGVAEVLGWCRPCISYKVRSGEGRG